MSLIKKMRRQIAVWWASTGVDRHGDESYAVPVEIKCRWEDSSEEFLDAEGQRQMSNAIVYVDRDTPNGGVLMLGTLDDITDPINVKENTGAWEIRKFDNLPNIRATEFLKTAIL
jgi:hypothetical protein